MIKLTDVYKVFFPGTVNEIVALNKINLQIKAGDFVTVIGSNGAGKSTLLNVISGVEMVDAGALKLAGRDVTACPEYKRAADIGRIDQNPLAGTAAEMTIEENLAMACLRGQKRGLKKAVTGKRRDMFREVLVETGLGLENRLQTPVGTLSGGQRQALALVMAMLILPKLLLLDEHTAALDPKAAQLIIEITAHLVQTKHLTTVMITHNMEQALKYGNRLIMMHRGRIVLDINQEEKSKLTVPHLIEKFTEASGTALTADRVLLM
ncbi:MAG: ATP-binding cassette domain-containing protein [Clostridia bacterium]|jgi:putative ABC transport system ATP-binding protein|nr:ATP-binding cassette domain-containing protein [Clostridia bacterium]